MNNTKNFQTLYMLSIAYWQKSHFRPSSSFFSVVAYSSSSSIPSPHTSVTPPIHHSQILPNSQLSNWTVRIISYEKLSLFSVSNGGIFMILLMVPTHHHPIISTTQNSSFGNNRIKFRFLSSSPLYLKKLLPILLVSIL